MGGAAEGGGGVPQPRASAGLQLGQDPAPEETDTTPAGGDQ